MSQLVRLCVILFVLLIGLAFHLVNDQFVQLNYYFGNFELPFSLMLVLALCAGATLGMLACLPMLIKLKRRYHALDKRIKIAERELNKLRIISVKDEV